jgi:hypothetical protein
MFGQTGGGNFLHKESKSVKAALTAASERALRTRFILHIFS